MKWDPQRRGDDLRPGIILGRIDSMLNSLTNPQEANSGSSLWVVQKGHDGMARPKVKPQEYNSSLNPYLWLTMPKAWRGGDAFFSSLPRVGD